MKRLLSMVFPVNTEHEGEKKKEEEHNQEQEKDKEQPKEPDSVAEVEDESEDESENEEDGEKQEKVKKVKFSEKEQVIDEKHIPMNLCTIGNKEGKDSSLLNEQIKKSKEIEEQKSKIALMVQHAEEIKKQLIEQEKKLMEQEKELEKEREKEKTQNTLKVLSELITESLSESYINWTYSFRHAVTCSVALGCANVIELRKSFYLKVVEDGEEICKHMTKAAEIVMQDISKKTPLIPLSDVKDRKIEISVTNLDKSKIYNGTLDVMTIGKFGSNIIRSLVNDVSRLNTLIFFMWDTELELVIMFLIDSWSYEKTALVDDKNKVITHKTKTGEVKEESKADKTDSCRKLLMTKLYNGRPSRVQVGGDTTFIFSIKCSQNK